MPVKLWSERLLGGFTIFLVLTGVVMVYSASSIIAEKRFDDSFFFLKRHMVYAFISIMAMLTVAKIDYQHVRKIAYPFLGAVFCLLILLLVPGVGTEVGGATRWLRIGPLSLQPSEIAKLAAIFFLATSFARKKDISDLKKGYMPYMIVLFLLVAPMVLQPDFGTSMTLAGIVFIMLFAAGARPAYLASSLLVVTGLRSPFLIGPAQQTLLGGTFAF